MDRQTNLLSFFNQHVISSPNAVAIKYYDEEITYQVLDNQANQLANFLQRKGCKSGDRIGILLNRSLQMYTAMLAVLKLGACYVPIHPEFPTERIQYIAENSELTLLITTSNFDLPESTYQTCLLDQETINMHENSDTHFVSPEVPNNALAYIIYTSGTTGHPKGIKISHEAVCNYIVSAQIIYGIKPTDRVYQGFTISFDASVEEIWLTLSYGATLVPGLNRNQQVGKELVNFLNHHHVTVFSCVPTILSTLEPPIPSLRLLILGGEVCHQMLLLPWYRQGLRILNTYGPSEATVVTTYFECKPEAGITIGVPLPNYEVFLLDKNLTQVKLGEVGEIYISGKSLALGYVKSPELDEKKFIIHPQLKKRMYKTGDLAQQTETEDLKFIGRVDNQIKLRGYRIELDEITKILLQFPEIKNAVVALKILPSGLQTLVAYLVLHDGQSMDENTISNFLRSKLPAYMMPAVFEFLPKMPQSASGKIDPNTLPLPAKLSRSLIKKFAPATNETEEFIIQHLLELFHAQQISIHDDFFHELNMHSLLAAQLISQLRKNEKFSWISIRDLYEFPTTAKLAEKINSVNHNENKSIPKYSSFTEGSKKTSNYSYYMCNLFQTLGVYIRLGLSAWQFLTIYLFIIFFNEDASILSLEFIGKFLGLLLGINFLLFFLAIASKWLLLGRVKPGVYPLWGKFYFKWWLVERIQNILPLSVLLGTPLMIWYARLMGARIGRNCYISTPLLGIFDLLTLGNNCSLNSESSLLGYKVDKNKLVVGHITLGNNSYVGVSSLVEPNTCLNDGAVLEDLSMLSSGRVIPTNKIFSGSPAAEVHHNRIVIHDDAQTERSFRELVFGIVHFLLAISMLLMVVSAITPGIILIDIVNEKFGLGLASLGAPISALSFIVLWCTLIILVKKLLIGNFKPGEHSIHSIGYLKNWYFEALMSLTLSMFGTLYATLYLIPWLRCLGAKIGKWVEISTLLHMSPDLISIGDESFIADGVQIGIVRVDQAYAKYAYTVLEQRVFVGNSAVIPSGSFLEKDTLLASLSISPNSNFNKKISGSWLGSPPIFLPNREKTQDFRAEETYRPSLKLIISRFVFDFFRVITPITFMFITIVLQIKCTDLLIDQGMKLSNLIILFPIIYGVILGGLSFICIILKWLLMGNYVSIIKPAWSNFVFKNELITGLFDFYFAPEFLEVFIGTGFAPIILRALGMKVGARTWIYTTNFTEFDLISIGDNCSLNNNITIQPHLFEDRIFKTGKITIQNNCTVHTGSVVLYDTILESGSTLSSLSLIMKGEVLLANTYFEGIPARRVL